MADDAASDGHRRVLRGRDEKNGRDVVIPCVTAPPLSLEVRAKRASKDADTGGLSPFETRVRARSSGWRSTICNAESAEEGFHAIPANRIITPAAHDPASTHSIP